MGYGLLEFARGHLSCNLPCADAWNLALCTSLAAMLLPANVHLGVREPGVRVDLEHREGVGDRREGDVRGLGARWFYRDSMCLAIFRTSFRK